MKTRSINWLNGESLYAEHLQENNDCLERFIINLKPSSYYGIKNLVIDETVLAEGIIRIKNLEAIFPDGTYVNYDDKAYDLTYNMEEFANQVGEGKLFYLVFDSTLTTNKTVELQSGQLVSFKYKEPKISITPEKNDKTMAFLEVKITNGCFTMTDFLGPRLTVEASINTRSSSLFEELKGLLLFIKNNLNSLRDREYLDTDSKTYTRNLLFIQQLFMITGNLQTFINNPTTPKDLYLILNDIIGIVGWKHLSVFPLIPSFDPETWVSLVKFCINKIYEIISGNRINHKSISFKKENGYFVVNFNEIPEEDPIIIIEPNNTETQDWIKNTSIASKNCIEEVKTKRIRGIKREIIESSRDLLIVKLDRSSEFLCKNNDLIILDNPEIPINSINLSLSIESSSTGGIGHSE